VVVGQVLKNAKTAVELFCEHNSYNLVGEY
jgi:hypothetical protein